MTKAYKTLRVASWIVFIAAMVSLLTFNIPALVVLAAVQFFIKKSAKEMRKEI